MTAKCECFHCGGNLEFEANDFVKSSEDSNRRYGQAVACPHCGKSTNLYMMRAANPPPKTETTNALPRRKGYRSAVFLLAAIGLGLIISGCASQGSAKSAMHETTAAVQYCSGWLMVGLAIVVETLSAKD
jgi:hypothetical protein